MKRLPDDLNTRERAFIQEYLIDKDPQRAYKQAGYHGNPAVVPYQMLAKSKIRLEIDKRMQQIAQKAEVTSVEVMQELKKVGFNDISRAFDKDGRLLNIQDIPKDILSAVQSIESDEIVAGKGDDKVTIGHTRKLKFHDKLKALELLGKQLKMFGTDDGQRTGVIVNIVVQENNATAAEPSDKYHDVVESEAGASQTGA